MSVLVVAPTYQEAENIELFIAAVRSALPDADVLIVDDSSPDGTGGLVKKYAESDAKVHLLSRPQKSGLGSAYRDSFAWALEREYDVLVEMDADFSHDPNALPGLVAALSPTDAMVIGARYIAGGKIPRWSLARRALSRGGNQYAAWALGLPVHDATSGFRVFARQTVADLVADPPVADGYGFQIEVAYDVFRRGGNIREHPICFGERAKGHSKLSRRIVVEALVLVTWWASRDRLLPGLRKKGKSWKK